jgi:hypothetical protein
VENVTTKKKIVTGILLVVIVGLILGSVYLMQRMPQFREATQEEILRLATSFENKMAREDEED